MLVHTISIFTATGDYYALLFVYLQPVIPLVVCRHRLCYPEHMSNHPMFDFTFYNLTDTMSHAHMVGMCTQQRFWKRFEVCKVIRKEHLQINYSGNITNPGVVFNSQTCLRWRFNRKSTVILYS